jgi:WS/DGAT/MGAT family acyltransferase
MRREEGEEVAVISGTRIPERLTAADDYSVLADDFGWPWDIGVIAVLDGTSLVDGEGGVRIDAVRSRIALRLHLVPRFRQLLYRPRLGLGWPLWVDAPTFDLAEHVRVHPLPAPAGEAELLAACEQLRRRRLDPNKPLWELWVLPGLAEGRMGLFLRMHHAIADGVAGVAAFGALLDLAPDAITPPTPPWTPQPPPSAGELFRDNVRWRLQGLRAVGSGSLHPGRTLDGIRAEWPTWHEVFTEERAPRTSLNRRVGRDRRVALVDGRLEAAKQIAHAHGAKVNDVVLAAVAGGLRELLGNRGERVDELVLRVMVPVSLHREQPGRARGNLDGLIVVRLPLGEPDPVRLLEAVAAETAERKRKPRPQAMSTGIFRFTLARRALMRVSAHQHVLNLTVTNVPGPPIPLYLAGSRLLTVFPVVPATGNHALTVGVLSYAGQLNLTAVADADACPDVDVFAHGLRSALRTLTRPSVQAAGWTREW